MFAAFVKTALPVTLLIGSTALAAPSKGSAQAPTIPVTIDLSEIQALSGPLYISIQKEEEFQGMRGHGGIIQSVTSATTQATYKVDVPGRYAISVWHDLNDDGVFSMDESYNIQDGWGGSGTVTQEARPTFEDSAFDVPAYGANVSVTMFYPE
jgi:uncharacterized protein (DUF2141 family)